jgi:uncharacterized membrane protein YdjX (TVP38/TMEM64 family)
LLAVIGGLWFWLRQELSLEALAERESQLRELQQTHPAATYGGAFLVYVLVTALSLPGAAAMSLAYGWLFGFWPGVVLVSFASTTGATAAFLLARYFVGEAVQARFGKRLSSFNEALDREGAYYLFTLRLVPAAPFFVINAVMGLTKIRVWTFWWVSQLGMLPGTCVYVYAGSSVPTLEQIAEQGTGSILRPELLVAFALLGLFPLLVRKLVKWRQGKKG